MFDQIESFIAENRSGYFRLTADPGEGKTAIMAEYVRRTGCVAHFNVLSETYNNTAQFTQHVATQLVARRLIADAESPADGGVGVADLLIEARAALSPPERLVLVVDALDEADRRDLPPTANVLLLPRTLPPGVHVLVSSRRNQDVPLRVSSVLIDMDLADYADASLDDVRDLLTRRSSDGPLRAWISDRGITPDAFVETLTEKSRGNFMYLRHVLPELVFGSYRDLQHLDDLGRRLPAGLENFYQDHWRLMGMTDPASATPAWVLYLLCELARPVSVDLLALIMQQVRPEIDVYEIQRVLDEWSAFLRPTDDGRRSIYHDTFRGFLRRQDVVESVGLSLPRINGVIADVLWEYENIPGGRA
ncbi:hypothetical protein [Streptomyces luteogriseus]|uniref:hypothetical protein n=1 Tax=Streptomyces luteogriseus TaxID=68233 RepID=UPI002E377B8B|nr:hypothetical protein [Streptomyces luteogriseus]WTJ33000.1 hypothetical protein OID52_41245 [Streptomyces luteogriseus]